MEIKNLKFIKVLFSSVVMPAALCSCVYAKLLTQKPTITFDESAGHYSLKGPITFNTDAELAKRVPQGSTLYFESSGGRSGSAENIANWAYENEIQLVITGACMSACASMIAAVPNAKFDGKVGLFFHGAGPADSFYQRFSKNAEFVKFSDRASKAIFNERSKNDKQKKLIGVAVPYFWLPNREELECYGVSADVLSYSEMRKGARNSGMYFVTADLPLSMQSELSDICDRWQQRS